MRAEVAGEGVGGLRGKRWPLRAEVAAEGGGGQ